jgi:hypothetical protein
MVRGEKIAAGFLLNVTGPLKSKEVGETAEAVRSVTDLRKIITIKAQRAAGFPLNVGA